MSQLRGGMEAKSYCGVQFRKSWKVHQLEVHQLESLIQKFPIEEESALCYFHCHVPILFSNTSDWQVQLIIVFKFSFREMQIQHWSKRVWLTQHFLSFNLKDLFYDLAASAWQILSTHLLSLPLLIAAIIRQDCTGKLVLLTLPGMWPSSSN